MAVDGLSSGDGGGVLATAARTGSVDGRVENGPQSHACSRAMKKLAHAPPTTLSSERPKWLL